MSQWARSNPEAMSEIASLPLSAQGEALRGAMGGEPELRLRMRGSVFRDVWFPVAERLSLAGEIDLDLADIASRVRVKAVGGGYRAFLSMSFEQGERWATWLPKAHADALLRIIADERAKAEAQSEGVR